MPTLDYIIQEREARAMRQAQLRRPDRSVSQSFSARETSTANSLNNVVSYATAYDTTFIENMNHLYQEVHHRGQNEQTVEERAVIIFETLKRAAAIGGGQKGELDPDSLVRLTADLIFRLSPVFEDKKKGTILSMYVAPGDTYQTTVGSYHNTGAIPVEVIVRGA